MMSLFPGRGGEDILTWRGVAAAAAEVASLKAERLKQLPYGEGIGFLREFQGRLRDEIRYEKSFAAEVDQLVARADAAGSPHELTEINARFRQAAADYFLRRGSVISLLNLSTRHLDRMLNASIRLASAGDIPPGCCWLARGQSGRCESAFDDDPSWYLIHGEPPGNGGRFRETAVATLAILKSAGVLKGGEGYFPVRLITLQGWRESMEELARGDLRLMDELTHSFDIRRAAGDAGIAEEAAEAVRRSLHDGAAILEAFRTLGKERSEAPGGLDLFGRLRTERGEPNRGRFALDRLALDPLVANVRMLAIHAAVRETGTIGRIEELLERGLLSVDLSERLLLAFHDFMQLRIKAQIAGARMEGGCFIEPPEPGSDDEIRLRNGLDAVSGLQKLAYMTFAEHG